MEKTTKKRKKSKRLKRRIGLIAVGGLSFVLTICLSIGATLAWFAGSTWASNDMYMGGPVYVEMAGRGHNGYATDGKTAPEDLAKNAVWKGGHGTLDIVASSRSTGTATLSSANADKQSSILLPGQKLLIYSQARVYSTLETSTVASGAYDSESSGANNSNTSDGTYTYYNGKGTVQSTTTSVLRAKFSINIEFDPSVGFNNFTDKAYAQGYPVQSNIYRGEYGAAAADSVIGEVVSTGDKSFDEASRTAGTDGKLNTDDDVVTYKDSLKWEGALGATHYTIDRNAYATPSADTVEKGRRDAVDNAPLTYTGQSGVESGKEDYNPANYDAAKINDPGAVTPWVDGSDTKELWQVKLGLSKNIYKWKYVSKTEYNKTANASYRLDAPFNGMFNTAGGPSAADTGNSGTGNGFYAIYEHDASGNKLESDAFYKARTNSYLKSYVEHYKDDYGRNLVMEIGDQLATLEDALNNSFVNLVNQSSDNIHAGNIDGFTAADDGRVTHNTATTAGIQASWLYVDPVIGNDTNASDSASSVGGWWYLVATDNKNMASKDQTIITEIDNVTTAAGVATTATTPQADGTVKYDFAGTQDSLTNAVGTKVPVDAINTPYTPSADAEDNSKYAAPFKRYEHDSTNGVKNNDKKILNAKLYQITPNLTDKLIATNTGNRTQTTKVVSVAFPFVNGNFELPGQALTNIFANAKISFQITFQALQAFFPFSTSIDSIPSGTAITGTGKALNINNAIPIFNEAFDYLSWL